MTINIVAGWWLLPLAISTAAFVWASINTRDDSGSYGAGVLMNVFIWLVAAVPSLIAWLIWAVLT